MFFDEKDEIETYIDINNVFCSFNLQCPLDLMDIMNRRFVHFICDFLLGSSINWLYVNRGTVKSVFQNLSTKRVSHKKVQKTKYLLLIRNPQTLSYSYKTW